MSTCLNHPNWSGVYPQLSWDNLIHILIRCQWDDHNSAVFKKIIEMSSQVTESLDIKKEIYLYTHNQITVENNNLLVF